MSAVHTHYRICEDASSLQVNERDLSIIQGARKIFVLSWVFNSSSLRERECVVEREEEKMSEGNKDQSVFLFERFVFCSVGVLASSLRLHRGIVGKRQTELFL